MVYYNGRLRVEETVSWFHAQRRRLVDSAWAGRAAKGEPIVEYSDHERAYGQPNCTSA